MSLEKKNIAILLGDPSGIGPELVVKLLNKEISNKANIVVIGEKKILEDGENICGKKTDLKFVENFDEIKLATGKQVSRIITRGSFRSLYGKCIKCIPRYIVTS